MQTEKNELLKFIVEQSLDGESCNVSSELIDLLKELHDENFIEVVQSNGTTRAIPTKKAVEFFQKKSSFEIETGIEVPIVKRGGNNIHSKYPFDLMEKDQSFHIEEYCGKNGEIVDVVKKISSSVSAVNKKYRKESGTKKIIKYETNEEGFSVPVEKEVVVYDYEKKFCVRKASKEDPKGPGARVFRII